MGLLSRLGRRVAERAGRKTGIWGAGIGALYGGLNGAGAALNEGGDAGDALRGAAIGGLNGASLGFSVGRFGPAGLGPLGAMGLGMASGRAAGHAFTDENSAENIARRALRRVASSGEITQQRITQAVLEEGGDEEALSIALSGAR